MALPWDTVTISYLGVHSVYSFPATTLRDSASLTIRLDLPLQLGPVDTRSRGDKKGRDTFQPEKIALNNPSRIATPLSFGERRRRTR